MATERGYTKTIINKSKFTEGLETHDTIKDIYVKWGAFGSIVTVYVSQDFTTQQETDLDDFMTNWVDFTTAESLESYLTNSVYPFTTNLMNVFAAENISMGITQLGKTGEVLGLFVKKHDVESNGLPISLKDCFDTGSLYEGLAVIQYIRDNPSEYTGLSPFITDARLLKMKNDVETFLGVTPLST